jgi:transcriptional regulator with XRE-family HTH domain
MSELLLKDKLRELRIGMHYTQRYVGQYLNMTRQGYAHYEAGLRNPDYQTLIKLSKLYQIDINELINNQTTPVEYETLHDNEAYLYRKGDKKPSQSSSRVIQLSPDEKKLFNLYNKLNNDEKKEILTLLENKIMKHK